MNKYISLVMIDDTLLGQQAQHSEHADEQQQHAA